jgi:hypothetical protein
MGQGHLVYVSTPFQAAIYRAAADFTSQHVLGIVQAIACKTYSNYVNHLAATEVDAAFADYRVAE